MKFFQRDTWYRKLVQRSIQTFLPRRKTSSLRSRLLAITGIGALLVSGLTFAIGGVGAIVWPNAPAGEATGGTIMTYFYNAFGDPATGTGKSCSGSGVITGFDGNGTPRCSSLSDLGLGVVGSPTLTFTAPAVVMNGSGATLNWDTTNVSTCTKSGDWSGDLIGNQVNQSFTTLALTSNKSYTLTCSNTAGTSVEQTVNITVTTPTLTFTATNTAIISDSTATLNWDTTNVSTCTKSGDWSGDLIGNQVNQSFTTLALTSNKSYTLTCSNTAGTSVEQTVNITVTTPTTPTIVMPTPSPSTVNAGSSVTLSWNATPATSCTTTSPSLDDVSTWAATGLSGSGSRTFTITVSGNYTVTCYNGSVSSSQTVNITVDPITCITFDAPTGKITGYLSGCSRDVVIPSTINGTAVRVIGYGAFMRKRLTSVIIPNSVTTIEENAFTSNELTSVIIPNSVTNMNSYVLNGNNFPYSTAFIYARRSDGTDDRTRLISYAGIERNSVIIPYGVEVIGTSVFNAVGLTSITIPDTVRIIGWCALCDNDLTSVIIPNSVTTIGNQAFQSNNFTSVTIPNSVTSIGNYAFGHQNSSNGTIHGPSSPGHYVRTTYTNNSNNEFDKTHLPNYIGDQ